jgi:hypothetical protein
MRDDLPRVDGSNFASFVSRDGWFRSLLQDFSQELHSRRPGSRFGLWMKPCFRTCLIENTFTGEAVPRATVDIQFPAGFGGAHFVAKRRHLVERCERIGITVQHLDFRDDRVSLCRDRRAGRHAARYRSVHAARLRMFGAIRRQPHYGSSRFCAWVLVDRLESTICSGQDAAGITVNEVYHIGPNGKANGLHPERLSHHSFASFQDPDGNHWVPQEITTRLPARTDAATTSFGSSSDLANALQRAAVAHGEHEKYTGGRDENWPAWYAEYMVAEQAGAQLPT